MWGGDSWGLVVVHQGQIVKERYTFNVLPSTRFDAWSCTKSFTATAWGVLLDERDDVGLDTHVYDHLPQALPLSDPRKAEITVEHLLGMTSGIPGESAGAIATATSTEIHSFDHAFGHAPNRYGIDVGQLHSTPGSRWDYSDPAFAHLSVLFANVAGEPMDAYLHRHVLGPLAASSVSWTAHEPYPSLASQPNAHSGLLITPRDLARFGLMMMRHGAWDDRQLVPEAWVRHCVTPGINPSYGLGWWTNATGSWLPEAPHDAFGAVGYRSNRCYVVPSHDLVVARLGTGPAAWEEGALLRRVLDSVESVG